MANPKGLVSLFLAFVFLGGCAQAGMNALNPTPLPATAAMTVCNKTADGCSQQASFSLSTIRDLAIHVDWKNVPVGTRTQKLEMLDPGGGSYQIMNSSFVIEEGGTGQAATDVQIPVSGSMITQRGITGTWKLNVWLDGQMVTTQNLVLEQ